MSDFVAKVERRRRAPEAIAHRVALHLSSKEKRALVCEASEDVFFYSTLYRKIPHSHTPEVFDADGRDGVVKVLGLLKDFGKSGRAYGIVDRDFNFEDPSHLCDGMCFVLDAYSFENLLVESACLQQFGKAFFGIDGSSSHFQMWLSSLDNFLSGVSKILHLEHAIAIWCRQNSKKCNLNNVNIRSYIDVENDGTVVERSGNFEKFVLDTNVELPDGVEDAIAANRSLIASMPLHSWFRGHFLWSIFVKFLNEFRVALDVQFKREGRSRIRTRPEIGEARAQEAAIPYITEPESLRAFLCVAAS